MSATVPFRIGGRWEGLSPARTAARQGRPVRQRSPHQASDVPDQGWCRPPGRLRQRDARPSPNHFSTRPSYQQGWKEQKRPEAICKSAPRRKGLRSASLAPGIEEGRLKRAAVKVAPIIAPTTTKKGTSSIITTRPLLVASAPPTNAPNTVANGLPLRIVATMGLAAAS